MKETVSAQQYVLLPLWSTGLQDPQDTDDVAFDVKENEKDVHVSPSSSDKPKKHDDKDKRDDRGKSPVDLSIGARDLRAKFEEFSINSTNRVTATSAPVTAAEPYPTNSTNSLNTAIPSDIAVNMPELEDIVYSNDEEDVGAEADFSKLETNIAVSPIPTTRVHKDHPVTQIIGDLTSAPQTRSMTRMVKEQGGLHQINDEDFHTYLPKGKRAIGLKWVFRNKKDERGIVIRNKAILVAQDHTQEEGIDYDEVFAPVARIEVIRLFLAYASFMGFMVYQMDVKSAFLYGTIEEEVYVCLPPGFKDLNYPDKVYKVVKALYKLHQALRAWYETLANYLLENGFQKGKIDQTLSTNKELCKAFEKLMKDKFQMSSMGELAFFLGLQVKQKDDGILISQDKYVAKILRKFGFTDVKLAGTPIETEKPLLKDPDGLWYLKDSPFNLMTYSDNDYAGASLDRKSTTGAIASYCAQVLWIQNQLLDYGPFITAVSYKLLLFGLSKDAAVKLILLGFDQVMDFLNAHVIQKKVVVTKDVIRQDLCLDDVDGVECLPNEEIFAKCKKDCVKRVQLFHVICYHLTCYRVGKGFPGVETPLFAFMLVQPQPQAAEEDEEVEVPTAPPPPSLINVSSPVPQAPTPTPHASPPSPTQEQPT
uniref:Reverse transcriptase Ty1/copia-type domain-containing protein n=1 Tax=Tanacetum cinerariifolium TaxID=118510 RepID=A0A6L2K3D8_TANCI|nr:hypothetical protein [Tanacetum cinerariifolium]